MNGCTYHNQVAAMHRLLPSVPRKKASAAEASEPFGRLCFRSSAGVRGEEVGGLTFGLRFGGRASQSSLLLLNRTSTIAQPNHKSSIAHLNHKSSITYAWFKADVSTAQDYYPFGSLMPGRTYVAPTGAGYRFGFNGQQRDDEIAGPGNSMSALFWKYDARLGRRWNIDPVNIPSFSSYSTFMNNPILSSDPFGDKVKNGYDRDLQRANEKVKERTDALNQAQTRIGAAIGKARLAQAERRLSQINVLHRETENLIRNFEELNSTGFNDLDRLQDGNGTEVDVYLRIESNLNGRRFSTNIGEMEAERDLDGLTQVVPSSRSPVVKDDRSGIYLPVRSALYGKNTAVIIIDKNVHDKVRVLTHESGHAIYNVSNMLEYVIWLIDNPTTPPGGHGEGNPSGIEAYRRENEYLEKRK